MKDKTKRVIKKYYEFILTKIKLVFLQKKFHYEDVTLKYILKKNPNSKDLVIVFSSCTRKGIKARYNYMRTLEKIKANKLFILDDFASDHRGSYYLGANWTFSEERTTLALCKNVIETLKAEKVICCGSSKGGYSALNFGLQLEGSYIVAGGPQYYLYDYLCSGNSECLEHILGEVTDVKVDSLNYYLQRRIIDNPVKNQKIFIHFSDKEHTYEEHIKDLLLALRYNGYSLKCDIASYTVHSDISYFFPEFLVDCLSHILQ